MHLKHKVFLLIIAATLILVFILYETPQEAMDNLTFNQSVMPPEMPELSLSTQPNSQNTATPKQPTSEQKPSLTLVRHSMPDYDLPGELIQHLDALFERYHQGDLEAGYILARNLWRCDRPVLSNIDNLNKRLRSFDWTAKHMPEVMSQRRADANKAKLTEIFYYCKDVPIKLRQQGRDILKEVAEQGYIPAQHEYGSHFEPKDLSEFTDDYPEDYLKQWEENIQKAKTFLENAAQHGSLLSLRELSYRYRTFDPKNLTLSLTYALVFLHLISDEKYLNESRVIIENLRSELSPLQTEQALEQSEALINTIISNGSITEP